MDADSLRIARHARVPAKHVGHSGGQIKLIRSRRINRLPVIYRYLKTVRAVSGTREDRRRYRESEEAD